MKQAVALIDGKLRQSVQVIFTKENIARIRELCRFCILITHSAPIFGHFYGSGSVCRRGAERLVFSKQWEHKDKSGSCGGLIINDIYYNRFGNSERA